MIIQKTVEANGLYSGTVCLVDAAGNTYSASGGTDAYVITQTVIAVTATSQALIAANASRKYLSWMVIGTQDVTITPGVGAAVFGVGQMYQAGGSNKQGGSEEFAHGTPTNAFSVIAANTGSSVIVWEGA